MHLGAYVYTIYKSTFFRDKALLLFADSRWSVVDALLLQVQRNNNSVHFFFIIIKMRVMTYNCNFDSVKCT